MSRLLRVTYSGLTILQKNNLSRFLGSNLLGSNLLTKNVSRLLPSNLLIDTWTGLLPYPYTNVLNDVNV